MTAQRSKLTAKDRMAYGLFWSWNLIFLAFMTLGFAPRILPELLLAVRTNMIPLQYLFYALVLSLIPLIAVILGLTILRRAPRRLLALGYVVEGPLMLLLAVRFFVIRQASPGLVVVMVIAVLGMAAFLWHVLDPQVHRRHPVLRWLRLVGLTLMLLTSLYAAVWISFYALPIAAEGLKWIGSVLGDLPGFWRGLRDILSNLIRDGLIWLPFTVLGFILLIYTATLFVFTPLAVPLLSVRAWLQSLGSQVGRAGWLKPAALITITLVISGALYVLANRQPQRQVFELLKEPPASQEEAQALLQRENFIRSGLLNAYLAPFRYISAAGEVRHVSDIYVHTFNLKRETAFSVQRAYERVASPLLYDPVKLQEISHGRDNRALTEEPLEAARLYQEFFDQPIATAERDTIVRSVRSTWSADQAEAAWQAVDDREVHLIRQEIHVSENGDWADVEVMEVYQNQTAELQEVIYYFNLPESAVITGVWLGESEDREARFVYQVAPRGAAQTVYRNEFRRQQDPALMEQIGPRQYRLRAFPIPPRVIRWDESGARRISEEAPPFYLWFTYKTVASEDAWPMPRLAVKRNVYWDKDTVRLVNGDPYETTKDDWLPESVPAAAEITPQAHRVDLPGGLSVLALPAGQVALPALPPGLSLAVVLDRSRSMEPYAGQVMAALEQLKPVGGSRTDLYMTSSPFRGEDPGIVPLADFDPEGVVYFGGQDPAQLLAQFSELSSGRDYDAVLVLSDGGAYELGEGKFTVATPTFPVWMVHLDSGIPLGYDDGTLEVIQASGGGVVGSVDQALQRLAASLSPAGGQAGDTEEVRDVLDGYLWSVSPTGRADSLGIGIDFNDAGFEALAARRVILAEMQRYRGDLKDLETLDQLHALAREHGIVTPYSSMIVLVNAAQQRMLETMERQGDRFEREYEAPPAALPLGGVPEPHEWLLLALAAAFLVYYMHSGKLALNLTGRR